jgi:hypothetical protein
VIARRSRASELAVFAVIGPANFWQLELHCLNAASGMGVFCQAFATAIASHRFFSTTMFPI